MTSMVKPYGRIAVCGAGAWGLALAIMANRSGADVTVWGRDPKAIAGIEDHNISAALPDIPLPETIRASTDMETALRGAEAVLLVVPSKAVRQVSRAMSQHLPANTPVTLCAKGIEADTGLLMTEVAASELPGRPIGALSGPTFASEAAEDHPTAATISFPPQHSEAAVRLALTLSGGSFRAYLSDDVTGVEIGGAVKNVIAIACGMMAGAGFAENTRAALITRGIAEMQALARALDAQPETLSGLSGVGDLTLTCSSATSRNMSLGLQLGAGTPRAQCFDGRSVVVEGEDNARSVTDLARRLGVSMPICEAVRAVLHDGGDLGQTFAALWTRPIRDETGGQDLSIPNPASVAAAEVMRKRLR